MQNLGFVILALLIVAGFYGFEKNPEGCRKLGDDLRTDLTAIYTPGAVTTSTTTTSSVTSSTPAPTNGDVITLQPMKPASAATPAAAPTLAPTAAAPTPATATPPPPIPVKPVTGAPLQSAPPGALVNVDEFTDYNMGMSEARSKNKLVLLHFTGSDWCPYCQKLDQEVLSTSEFNQFVGPNFVVITLDFPHQKPLDDESTAANQAIQTKFHVSGFPTLIVMTPDEKELGRETGYNPGSGPTPVISELRQFAANH